MQHTAQNKGIATSGIIGIVAILAILGIGYFAFRAPAKPEPSGGEMMDNGDGEGAMMDKDKDGEAMMGKDKDGAMMDKDGDGAMMDKDSGEMMDEGGAMMDENGGGAMMEYSGKLLAGSKAKAPLYDFVKADYDKAVASDKLVVLYFYADWCPICKAEVPKLYEAFNELDTDRAIGFRVNYNDCCDDADEQALARRFGVGYQHTKVLVKNGERVLKAPDTWTKEKYLSEIKRLLAA